MIDHIQTLADRALICFRKGELTAVAGEQTLHWALLTLREIRDRRSRLPRPDKWIAGDVIRLGK
jgi:hypothetical protein